MLTPLCIFYVIHDGLSSYIEGRAYRRFKISTLHALYMHLLHAYSRYKVFSSEKCRENMNKMSEIGRLKG